LDERYSLDRMHPDIEFDVFRLYAEAVVRY